jgi:hypothetical protein
MEAWHSGRFRTYPRLPGWQGQAWSLLLVPGWRELDGRPLPEIVANQWAITTNQILDDLEGLPAERLTAVDYRQLLSSPQAVMEKLAGALDLDWDRILGRELPLSKTTVSRPREEKWREVRSRVALASPAKIPISAPSTDITAPPHGDVRLEPFLPLPGHWPTAQRPERIGRDPAGAAPDT